MTTHSRLLLCALVALTACATHGRTSSARRDSNIITAEEMRDGHFLNAYEAVQALHPNWLSARGPDSFSAPAQVEVYYGRVHLGTVETLRTVLPADIVYIRWYTGTEAQQQFGVGHSNGVIYISSHSD